MSSQLNLFITTHMVHFKQLNNCEQITKNTKLNVILLVYMKVNDDVIIVFHILSSDIGGNVV